MDLTPYGFFRDLKFRMPFHHAAHLLGGGAVSLGKWPSSELLKIYLSQMPLTSHSLPEEEYTLSRGLAIPSISLLRCPFNLHILHLTPIRWYPGSRRQSGKPLERTITYIKILRDIIGSGRWTHSPLDA